MRPINDDELTNLLSNNDSLKNHYLSLIDFSRAPNFSARTLENVNFDHSILHGVHFDGARMKNCSFSFATIENCSFKGTHMDHCSFEGVALKSIYSERQDETKTTKFKETNLHGVHFDGARMKNCSFNSATIENCSFKGTHMDHCSFERVARKLIYSERQDETKTTKFKVTNLHGVHFDGARMKNCSFSFATIENCSFKGTHMDHCSFEGAKLKSIYSERQDETKATKFKKTNITQTTFKEATITHGRFRSPRNEKTKEFIQKTTLHDCDFRYCKIIDCTFEDAELHKCDFYRTLFREINVFLGSKFSLCSFNLVYFEHSCILKDNLDRLVVENKKECIGFLEKIFVDDVGKSASFDKIKERYKEGERIYRNFSSMWESKGHYRDAEWAYLNAKRMAKNNNWVQLGLFDNKENCKWYKWPPLIIARLIRGRKHLVKGLLTEMIYHFTGYGTSISRIFIAYFIVIFAFSVYYSYSYSPSNFQLPVSFMIGLKSMLGLINITEEKCCGIDGFVSTLQTGIGILFTGFLGFVIANRLRKR